MTAPENVDPFDDSDGPSLEQVETWERERRKAQRGRTPALTPRRVVALNVRKARTAAGLTAQQLADRLSELGHPIPRASLSELETSNRGVDVDDLVALAVALGTSPTALMLPEPGQYVAPVPGRPRWMDWSRDDLRGWMGDATSRPPEVVREAVRRALEPILAATSSAESSLVGWLTMTWEDSQ